MYEMLPVSFRVVELVPSYQSTQRHPSSLD